MKERKKEQETGILSTLGAETLSPPYISSPSLIYRRHLKVSLCDLLCIFWYQNTICRQIHWILQYSFFTCPGQWWMERKEAVRFCLFVCLFYLEKLINLGAFGSVVSVSCLESETGRGGLCGSPCLTGIATAAPIKVLVPLLGYYLILRNSKFFILFFL